METTEPLKIGDTTFPAGNFALVFHPNTSKDEGMSFEVRKIPPGEFLKQGNVMTRTPEGETLWRAPVTFETATSTVPNLEIGIAPAGDGIRLDVRYGNRGIQQVFER